MPPQKPLNRFDREPSPRATNPFRFSLRSLILFMAAIGVFSGIVRSLALRDSTLFLAVAVFCYGGLIAIPCYAFVGSLMVLTATTPRGQFAGSLVAAAICCLAWSGFGVAFLGKWPQFCVIYSLAVVSIIGCLVRLDSRSGEGPSPEPALKRLLDVKKRCRESTEADGRKS